MPTFWGSTVFQVAGIQQRGSRIAIRSRYRRVPPASRYHGLNPDRAFDAIVTNSTMGNRSAVEINFSDSSVTDVEVVIDRGEVEVRRR